MLQILFNKLLLLSVSSAVILVIFLGMFWISKNLLNAKQKYYLLILPLFLCLIPFNFEMNFAIKQVEKINAVQTVTNLPKMQQKTPVTTTETMAVKEENHPINNIIPINKYANILKDNLVYIWILCVLILMVYKLICVVRFKKTLKQIAIEPTEDMQKIFDLVSPKKGVKLKCFNGISTPFITGIFKPTVFMPNSHMSEYELCMALKHELTHIKRHDLVIKTLADFATVIHFFNPFVYVLKNKINTYCELSCDYVVTKNMDRVQCKDYGKMLLSLMKQKNLNLKSTACLAESQKNIKQRMEIIMNKNKLSKTTIMAGILIVCFLTIGSIVFANVFNNLNNKSIHTQMPDKANILVMGIDGNNSDTIMFLSLDNKNKALSVMSIPRDTKAQIEGGFDKISSLYGKEKNQKSTIKAVEKIMGLPVDYYVVLDYNAFGNIVDALGGVEIDVLKDMNYEDPYQNLNISISKGKQILNGTNAEGFVRFRSGYAQGDLTRIENQQKFIKELIKQKLNSDTLAKAPDLFNQISQNIQTNFKIGDISALKSLSFDKVQAFNLPGNAQRDDNSIFYFVNNESETQKLIKEHFEF